MTPTRPDGKAPATAAKKPGGLSAEELAAMKETLAERRRDATRARGKDDAADEAEVLAKIAELSEHDRMLATKIHGIVKATAPALKARTWYGMPAYTRDGKVVVFFKPGEKFKSRYATLGFDDAAQLDDGEMWPTSYALLDLAPAYEKKIAALIKKAAGL